MDGTITKVDIKVKDKLLSARFLMAMAFSFTYCGVIIGSVILCIKKLLTVETFLAILAGFTPLVALIAEWYFKKERPEENY